MWNKAIADQKISEWNKTYDVSFFLLAALGRLHGFKKSFQDASELISRVNEMENPISQRQNSPTPSENDWTN